MEGNKSKRKLSLSVKILIGMLLGIVIGLIAGPKIAAIRFLGDVFMRLLRMCIYPMILLSIIRSISNVADIGRIKKVGGIFLCYVIVSSSFACVFGLVSMTFFRPGSDIELPAVEAAGTAAAESTSLIDSFVSWVPDNPFNALAAGNLIQIVFFAIVFGILLASVRGTENGLQLFNVVDALNDVIIRMINWVLTLAPVGICALMAVMVGTTGIEMMRGIAVFLLAYWAAILAFMLLFLPAVIKFGAKASPLRYYKNIFPVIIMALTTLSSVGTLPVTMRATRERCGVPADIVGLIAAPAATINMNGAAAEYTCYIIFSAYLYDVKLSLFQVVFAIVLCVVMSIGAAGVPGGGIIMSTICLSVMGLPQTIVPIIAGVYTLLDLGATVLNVISDTAGMIFIAARLGELDYDVFEGRRVLETSV